MWILFVAVLVLGAAPALAAPPECRYPDASHTPVPIYAWSSGTSGSERGPLIALGVIMRGEPSWCPLVWDVKPLGPFERIVFEFGVSGTDVPLVDNFERGLLLPAVYRRTTGEWLYWNGEGLTRLCQRGDC
jgi:hypothetical protein